MWPGLGGLWLDVRLAFRMLAKHPLLALVGGAGMAFGITAGVGGFQIRTQLTTPNLPLEDGSRVVGLRYWDVRNDRLGPVGDADFRAWRDQLRRVEDIGAASLVDRNLSVDGTIEPVGVAQMSAAGFRVARVPALHGRTLLEADEAPSAPSVAVIGHSLWQRRFVGNPRVVGRTVQLGTEQTTIVGVMPEDFGFPLAHQIWTPLRRPPVGAADVGALLVFGRLAPDISLDEARAELATVGQRMAIDAPDTHQFLRPEVVPYTHLVIDPRFYGLGFTLANVFLVTLLIVVCANVALLMFARAAAREREISVRTALGASRVRIVAQLFIEAATLSGLSVVVGLVAARYVLASLLQTLEADSGRPLPFWLNDRLTPSTIAYGVGLTMLCALITGVLPALKVTGRGLLERLRSGTAGGGGYRFGGVWTAGIAAQVAVTVLFPAAAFLFHQSVITAQSQDVGFPAERYLSARLAMDSVNAPSAAPTATSVDDRTMRTLEELRRQLTAEPGVRAVTFTNRLPGTQHPGGQFEIEGDNGAPANGYQARIASVDADFFTTVGAPVLSGRGFVSTDLALAREVAIVNRSFVERVLGGGNPLGRRIRNVALGQGQPPGPWIEVIGVARDLGVLGTDGIGLYRPLPPSSPSVFVAVQVHGDPVAFASRLAALAGRVDPTLRVHDVMPLDQVGASGWLESQYLSRLLAVISGLTMLLSLMAVYSVMAFTVVQRTREIGTRVALGAERWSIVATLVRRPFVQIVLGIAGGAVLVGIIFFGIVGRIPTAFEAGMIAAYALSMLAVCLTACLGPARRALRLQPGQVLRGEG